MMDSKMEPCHKLRPPDLAFAQMSLCSHVDDSLVIGVNFKMLEKIEPPTLQSKHHCQSFSLCNGIVLPRISPPIPFWPHAQARRRSCRICTTWAARVPHATVPWSWSSWYCAPSAKKLNVVSVYRPPGGNSETLSSLISNLDQALTNLTSSPSITCLVGDFKAKLNHWWTGQKSNEGWNRTIELDDRSWTFSIGGGSYSHPG